MVLTHLHGDHVGGLAAFDPPRVWVSKAEWEPVARFTASWQVTPDGSVIALPTPGHSPGHTSYLVRRPEGDVLLAGDVTYELPALESQREQGFIANVEKHHDSLRRVLSLVRSGVAYLPSHDPNASARL